MEQPTSEQLNPLEPLAAPHARVKGGVNLSYHSKLIGY